MGLDIWPVGDGPVSKCYACKTAEVYRNHYSDSIAKKQVVNSNLPFICPGADWAPRNCKAGVPHIVRSRGDDACVCEDGWFGSEAAGCELCPKGHYCMDGNKKMCADHTYQDNVGATSCEACSSSVCDFGQQLPWCLQTVPGSQNMSLVDACVPCKHCKRHYITPIMGQVDCYVR